MEIWKQYSKHYEVSNLGRVRSNDKSFVRKDGKPMRIKGRLLKGNIDTNGYRKFWHHENGVNKLKSFHVAVAELFLGYNPKESTKMVVDHVNENKLDNSVDNLQLISNRENVIKSLRHKGKLSSTGYPGVHVKSSTTFYAKAIVNGRQVTSGGHLTPESAYAAYLKLIK